MAVAPASASGQLTSDQFDATTFALLLSSFVAPTRVGNGGGGPPAIPEVPLPTFPGQAPPGSPFPNTSPTAGAGSTRECIRSKCGFMCELFPNIGPAGCKECIANCQQTVGAAEAPGFNLAGVAGIAIVVVGIILVLVAMSLIVK